MKNRVNYLDFIRSVAILCVILCHATEYKQFSIINNGEFIVSHLAYLGQTILFCIGRLGVPLFLMLTGALLLKKTREISIMSFYKRKLFPLVLVTEVWIIFNYIFEVIYFENKFQISLLIKQMCFLTDLGGKLGHMWYMPMIIGVYIIIPFINILIKNLQNIYLYIIIFFSFLPHLVNIFSVILNCLLGIETFGLIIDFSPLGGVFLSYVLIGYIIYNHNYYNYKKIICVFMIGIFVINVFIQYYLFYAGVSNYSIILWYTNPLLMLISTCVFYILCGEKMIIKRKAITKIAYKISLNSFPIYFLHYPIFIIVYSYIGSITLNLFIKSLLLTLFTFILSYSISVILNKNDKLGKFLFGR